jgi:hypothetical protein
MTVPDRPLSLGASPSWPWRRSAVWLALLAPLFYLTYGLANWWALQRWSAGQVPTVVFDWERHIPFWDWTIFPYWSINVFYGLSLFLSRSKHRIDRHAARLLTAQFIAVTCFVLFPLHFSFGQPEVQGAAGFLFAALRGFDQPFNQAPSLHVALAVILWDWYRSLMRNAWQRWLLHVWTFAICASVLTTYQHHFIDVPTGALLGVLCVWLWPLEREVALPAAWRLSGEPQRLKLAALYFAGAFGLLVLALGWGGLALGLLGLSTPLFLVALNYLGFGERGFRMDRSGNMHWSARWLFGPYTWAAAFNAWVWTRRPPPRAEVVPGVWLGRRPSHAEWLSAGRPALVSLCAELPLHAATQSVTRCLPMLDLVVPSPVRLKRAAHLVQVQRGAHPGGPVWVCCALGFSRSAAAVVAWQLLHDGASDLSHAEARTRRARPQLVLGPMWLDALRRLGSPTPCLR